MAVTLPDKYKAFMMPFGYVELFPIMSTPGTYHDLGTVNDREFPGRSFLAVPR